MTAGASPDRDRMTPPNATPASSVCIAVAVLTGVNAGFVVGVTTEFFWLQVAIRRMLDLEQSFGCRLITYECARRSSGHGATVLTRR
jgi:hypothetical protein